MKLRNKKTGSLGELKDFINDGLIVSFSYGTGVAGYRYDSLAELNEEWEDAEDINVPSTPLIKDEKIRKAVRIWAEVNGATGATELRYYDDENCLIDLFRNEIHFNQLLGLEDDKTYTVTELCGEAEE